MDRRQNGFAPFSYSILWLICSLPAMSQPEVTGWGNINGIRVEGQLMKLNSSLVVAGTDWKDISRTAKESQRPKYRRNGKQQIVTTNLSDVYSIREIVEDAGTGRATVSVEFTATKDTTNLGTYFSLSLPGEQFSNGSVEIIEPAQMNLREFVDGPGSELVRIVGSGVRFGLPSRKIEISTETPTSIIIRKSTEDDIELLMAIGQGGDAISKDQVSERKFHIRLEGEIDRKPAKLVMNPDITGRVFDGFGGNFRLQNPKTDPQVIEYCLENMRVAWARVEMPWAYWHRDEESDPLEAARAGNLHPHVQKSMELAQKIHRKGIPVIVSAWSGPDWAILGKRSFGPQPGGLRGNPLNPEKADQIYKSITQYIIYLKEAYGVETEMFSFNESDLGIYIRQTGEEHRDLIKGLGAFFNSKGLKTKLLLGDTADANGWPFLTSSLEDTGTLPYIGALSFHSWRGWETETLQQWAEAATQTNKPLLVGEGSIDAAAWNYPDIFQEQVYILQEINLYVRILAICQPQTILQWQLTADYSPLAGGNIFGDQGPLRPTQRFWNLKQLSATPPGLASIPISTDHHDITCAALGDHENKSYTIHIVNNGASREAILSGLPSTVKEYMVYVTNSSKGMEESGEVLVNDGQVKLTLDQMSYTTLIAYDE